MTTIWQHTKAIAGIPTWSSSRDIYLAWLWSWSECVQLSRVPNRCTPSWRHSAALFTLPQRLDALLPTEETCKQIARDARVERYGWQHCAKWIVGGAAYKFGCDRLYLIIRLQLFIGVHYLHTVSVGKLPINMEAIVSNKYGGDGVQLIIMASDRGYIF